MMVGPQVNVESLGLHLGAHIFYSELKFYWLKDLQIANRQVGFQGFYFYSQICLSQGYV